MKQLYNLLLILTTVFFFACQEDDEMSSLNGKGYLRLQVGQNAELTTKADEYKSERIAVYIKDSEDKIVKQTTDFDAEWKGTDIELSPGEYTIEAESYGWDGEAGEDKAYYKGSTTVTIEKDKSVDAEVVCYLANVKVTVAFEQDFLTALGDGTITVQVQNVNGQTTYKAMDFSKSAEKQVAYFAATDIDVKYTVTTEQGKNERTREIREVKAKDHYILNFRLAPEGTENVTVTVDPTMTLYEYTFNVSTTPKNSATMSAGAWDRLAYLMAENVTTGTGVSPEGMKFQYREKVSVATQTDENTTPWNDIETTNPTERKYVAMLTGLTASKVYEYRLVNKNNEAIGDVKEFETCEADAKTTLYNGDFDLWYQSNNAWYPNASGTNFWDSGNPAASIGAMFGTPNPTLPDESVVHTQGQISTGENRKSAKLTSDYIVMAFAAGNIYTGQFGETTSGDGEIGATLSFGQPFTSRPIALHGFFQYAPVAIDNIGPRQPANTVNEGDMDKCSIYIALAKKAYSITNIDESTYIDFDGDTNIIAYGELPADQCVNTGGEWKEFNIPLQYKEACFGDTPTHIIIVCSASKYGDYFTGGDGSTMYLDDFSLVYDGEPTIWDLPQNN